MAKKQKNLGGRPRGDNPRRNRLSIVFTDEELAKITEAASNSTSRLDWMRTVLLKAAKGK